MMVDRKGMVAVMDAMLFIVILGLTVSLIFMHSHSERDDRLSAERIHKDLFSVEMKASDVFDAKDPRILSMEELLAVHIGTGEGKLDVKISEMLHAMVPISHGFLLWCTYEGRSVQIGSEDGEALSKYGKEFNVAGRTLSTVLMIY